MNSLKRSTAIGFLGALLVGGACRAQQDADQSSDQAAQVVDNEFVEVTVRMPDGRTFVLKERKYSSRLDPRLPIFSGERPPVVVAADHTQGGDVNSLDPGMSGGSNGSSGSLTKAGSGSGGGGGSSGRGGGGGGGGGGTNGDGTPHGTHDGGVASLSVYTPPPNVLADNDYTVRMFAWDNAGAPFNHITRTYIVDPRSKTPERLARNVASEVSREHPERVVLRFWKELHPADRYPFDITNPTELINSGGYTQGLEEYWETFAKELARLGVRPDYLVFDLEKGIDVWEVPASDRYRFFQALLNPVSPITRVMPESMSTVSVEQFLDFRDPQGTQALNDYSIFAKQIQAALLKRVFGDVFDAVYGEHIPISNYRDINMSFTAYIFSGRPFPEVTVGGISAPVTYLDQRAANAPRYVGTQKDQRWNRLIDSLNRCRSSASHGLVTPWISAPGYGIHGPQTYAQLDELDFEYWIWEVMMDQLLAMGIDTFIVWNPGLRHNASVYETDAFMDQWLADHPVGAGPQLGDLPEILLDADEIETNGVILTYRDFMEAQRTLR